MEYSKAFELEETHLSYKVEPLKESAKVITSRLSMPSYFVVIIRHSLRREFQINTSDGEFHPEDEQEILIALESITVDSSLFSFKDMFVHSIVHRALSSASINPKLWEAISDAVIMEGIRMARTNLEAHKGWNSKCPNSSGRVNDTLSVKVVKLERYVCCEGFGEC